MKSTSQITFLVLLALGTGTSLQAAKTCTDASLKGTFGEIGWGAIPTPVVPGLAGPFVRVGQTIADGNGNVYSHTAGSFNGIIFQVDKYGGTYIVNPDCTIIFHMHIPIPNTPPGFLLPTDLTGVISDDGKEVANVVVSPEGLSIRILFHKLTDANTDQPNQDLGGDLDNKGTCSNKDFNGGFGLDIFGNIISQPPNTPGVVSRTGLVVFDGIGGFTANSNVSDNGAIANETFSGTYNIDSGCKLLMNYSFGGVNYTWFGGLSNERNGATVMQTIPQGTALAGTLTRQQTSRD